MRRRMPKVGEGAKHTGETLRKLHFCAERKNRTGNSQIEHGSIAMRARIFAALAAIGILGGGAYWLISRHAPISAQPSTPDAGPSSDAGLPDAGTSDAAPLDSSTQTPARPAAPVQTSRPDTAESSDACGELAPDQFGEALGDPTGWRENIKRDLKTVFDFEAEARPPLPKEMGPDEPTMIKVGTDLTDRVDWLTRLTCRKIIETFLSDILRTAHTPGKIVCAGNSGEIQCTTGPTITGSTAEERLMHASCLEWVRGQIADELQTIRPRLACVSKFEDSSEKDRRRTYLHRITCRSQKTPAVPPQKRQPLPRTKRAKAV